MWLLMAGKMLEKSGRFKISEAAKSLAEKTFPEAFRHFVLQHPDVKAVGCAAIGGGYLAPTDQWRSVRTTNAIERLHEEFKRRIKTQTVLPSADTAAMLFWALLASGQINMRKVDGWQSLATTPIDQPIDLAA
jgi:hypothetical protein